MIFNLGRIKINRFLLLIIFITFSKNIISQTTKTYNGSFEEGKATYQYYENQNFDRIFDGDFTYLGRFYNTYGFFKNNHKDGKWKIKVIDNVYYYGNEPKLKLNTDILGTYQNGELFGTWKYSNSICIYNSFSKKYSTELDNEISTAKFLNNRFIDTIHYESNWPTKLKIDGQFTNSGIMNGNWIFDSQNSIEIIKYNNGVEYWRLKKKKSTGEKIDFVDNSNFVNTFWSNYDKTTNTSEIDGVTYYPEVLNLRNEAIKVWINENISAYDWSSISNPLYYYNKGCFTPKAYEIVIKECIKSVVTAETGWETETETEIGCGNNYNIINGKFENSENKIDINLITGDWQDENYRITFDTDSRYTITYQNGKYKSGSWTLTNDNILKADGLDDMKLIAIQNGLISFIRNGFICTLDKIE
jgi:hypothetical protein